MSQSDDESWEMVKRTMSDQELTALFENNTRKNAEKSRRKAANKQKARMDRTNAIERHIAHLGPEVQWPISGPMKVVNGKAVGGFSVTYPEVVPEWKDDPLAKASVKTSEQIEKERIEEKLKFWPFRNSVPRDLVTLAPFYVNTFRDTSKPGQPFALPEVQQTCLLFEKLFSNELILRKITGLLFTHHDTASKFALTSRESWRLITYYTANWDFTRGWFGNCEVKRCSDVEELNSKPTEGVVAPVVIVSPVRGPLTPPSNIEDLDVVPETIDERLYFRQLLHLHKMCTAMYNFADYFQNLQFHRIPFLTTAVLSLVIPPMRNLKVLGIYKCPLIHIGDTMKLLEIIQVDKTLDKKNQISLDFFPNYHQGPIAFPGSKYHQGTYGVTWDNWNGDTRLAVWQLVATILPQAEKQKQDFLSKHTMFRQWLDLTPCWRVAETLKTMLFRQGDTRTQQEIEEHFVVMCDYANSGGNKTKLKSKMPNCPEGWEWKLQRHPCSACGMSPLGIFFYYNDVRQGLMDLRNGNPVRLRCLSCRLTRWLDNEEDHYKRLKRRTIKDWLLEEVDAETGEETWNDTNMPKALEDFRRKKIWSYAQRMDRLRINEMLRPQMFRKADGAVRGAEDAIDREYDEGQKELTREELGRLGMKNRSPTVNTKDQVFDQWNAWDDSRIWGHGKGNPF